jgi:Ni/Fe-hydrogenase 1 B-type cytochrome subunit
MERRHPKAVRLFHWWNAISIFALIFSGFYIHNPYGFFRWMFGNMDAAREVHFIFAYCLVAGMIGRLYYAFVTGDYKNFAMGKKDPGNMIKLMMYYMFISDEEPDFGGKYNPGQKGMYASFVPLIIIQILTGMILYWPVTFAGWAIWIGGAKWIRLIHYIVCWIFVFFVAAHMYLDFSEGVPSIVAMFTGMRPVKAHHGHDEHAVAAASVEQVAKS